MMRLRDARKGELPEQSDFPVLCLECKDAPNAFPCLFAIDVYEECSAGPIVTGTFWTSVALGRERTGVRVQLYPLWIPFSELYEIPTEWLKSLKNLPR